MSVWTDKNNSNVNACGTCLYGFIGVILIFLLVIYTSLSGSHGYLIYIASAVFGFIIGRGFPSGWYLSFLPGAILTALLIIGIITNPENINSYLGFVLITFISLLGGYIGKSIIAAKNKKKLNESIKI